MWWLKKHQEPNQDFVVLGLKEVKMNMHTHTAVVRFLQLSTINARSPAKTAQLQAEWTNKLYHYLTTKDVKPGDYAVVMSPIFGEPAMVQVEQVLYNTKSDMAFKYLVDIVDFGEYNSMQATIAAEAEAKRERLRRRNAIEHELAKARQRAEAAFVEEYISRDPSVQQLRDELKSLIGSDTNGCGSF